MRMLLSFQRPPSLSKRGFLSRRPIWPRALGRSAGQPRSIALIWSTARGGVRRRGGGALKGYAVRACRELGLAQCHASLVDQAPRLRAPHAELLGDQAGQVEHAVVAVD